MPERGYGQDRLRGSAEKKKDIKDRKDRKEFCARCLKQHFPFGLRVGIKH